VSEINWFQKTPKWFWWSFFPVLGGLAIAYAGQKSNTKVWIAIGIGLTAVSLVLSEVQDAFLTLLWFAQIGTALAIKQSYLIKTYPHHLPLPDNPQLAQTIAQKRPKVDVNNCSKDDLVYGAGLPIAYANDIELLRNEGHIFTSSEELANLVDIPNNIMQRVEPLLVFGYYTQSEAEFSWRCLNTESIDGLVTRGMEADVAKQIVAERQKNGEFRSVADVKRRTGLPLKAYEMVVY
jgi:DNA uptake protein ComE-like DNA-binding protein